MMNSLMVPLKLNSTCQISTTEATGTIMGLRKKVRNWLFSGMRHSSISASTMASTTARGTATAEKLRVFFAAMRKAELSNSFMKFCKNTKFFDPTPSISE